MCGKQLRKSKSFSKGAGYWPTAGVLYTLKLLPGFSLSRTLICSSKMCEKHLWKGGI